MATLIVRGQKIRCQSKCRYVVIGVSNSEILKRSNSLATARSFVSRTYRGSALVIVDQTTGQEV